MNIYMYDKYLYHWNSYCSYWGFKYTAYAAIPSF